MRPIVSMILLLTMTAAVFGQQETRSAKKPQILSNPIEPKEAAKEAPTPVPQTPMLVTHPTAVRIYYTDLHRICPRAILRYADVRHPYIPGQQVRVQFYAPPGRPMIREWPRKTVYNFGIHEVEIKYLPNSTLVVDYDGPSRRFPTLFSWLE